MKLQTHMHIYLADVWGFSINYTEQNIFLFLYVSSPKMHMHLHTHKQQQKVWLQREEQFTSSGLTKIYRQTDGQTGRHGQSNIHPTFHNSVNGVLKTKQTKNKTTS